MGFDVCIVYPLSQSNIFETHPYLYTLSNWSFVKPLKKTAIVDNGYLSNSIIKRNDLERVYSRISFSISSGNFSIFALILINYKRKT